MGVKSSENSTAGMLISSVSKMFKGRISKMSLLLHKILDMKKSVSCMALHDGKRICMHLADTWKVSWLPMSVEENNLLWSVESITSLGRFRLANMDFISSKGLIDKATLREKFVGKWQVSYKIIENDLNS